MLIVLSLLLGGEIRRVRVFSNLAATIAKQSVNGFVGGMRIDQRDQRQKRQNP